MSSLFSLDHPTILTLSMEGSVVVIRTVIFTRGGYTFSCCLNLRLSGGIDQKSISDASICNENILR